VAAMKLPRALPAMARRVRDVALFALALTT
jgi:hypothetical protein